MIAALAAALTVMLVLGSAAALDASTAVPRGTTVLGVDIGGRTEAEAADALRAGLGDRLAEAVPVTLDGAATTLIPPPSG